MNELMSLSADQQKELQPIVALLINRYGPVHVICFGTSLDARSTQTPLLKKTKFQKYRYYLLMVLPIAISLPNEPQEFLDSTLGDYSKHPEYVSGYPWITIITHLEEELKLKLEKENIFFRNTLAFGYPLFTNNEQTIVDARLSVNEKPTDHYKRKIQMQGYDTYYVESFLDLHSIFDTVGVGDFIPNQVFLLNKTLQMGCCALLMIHCDYQPNTTNLDTLLNLIGFIHEEWHSFFPRTSPEDRRLFDMLNQGQHLEQFNKDFEYAPNEFDASTYGANIDLFCEYVISSIRDFQEEHEALSGENVDEAAADNE